MTSSYFNLHQHSHYSAVDGMASVPDLVKRASLYGQPGVALTDHGRMAGSVELYAESVKAGLKPYPGIEAYLIDPDNDSAFVDDKGKAIVAERFHVGLVALNYRGYQGLVGLNNTSFTRPRFNRFPRVTFNDLVMLGQEYGDDLILTTGCYFGLVIQRLLTRGYDDAKRVVAAYRSAFKNTLVELQDHGSNAGDDIDDAAIVASLTSIADELSLPLVVTQDSHYLEQRDRQAHNLMKRMVYRGDGDDTFPGSGYHAASAEWMSMNFTDEVWRRSEDTFKKIIDMNQMTFPLVDDFKPRVPVLSTDPRGELTRLCDEALDVHLETIPAEKHQQYRERLAYELTIVDHHNLYDYFLLVRDVVFWCNKNKICVESRGSANGSLITFLLRITQVDPIKYGITISRFIGDLNYKWDPKFEPVARLDG